MTQKEIIIRINQIDLEIARREKENKLDNYNSGEKKHLKDFAFHKCK